MRAPQDNATVEPGGLLRLRPGFFGGVDGDRGQHVAQLRGGQARSAAIRLCCGAVQGGQVPAWQSSADPAARCPARVPADVVLILPWNIAAEVAEQHGYIRNWGRRFVAIPSPTLL